MQTLKICYDALAAVSRQLHEGLITEPEWLTNMVDILLKRDRHLKEQAAIKLNEYLDTAWANPMTSKELKQTISNWQNANYYLINSNQTAINHPA